MDNIELTSSEASGRVDDTRPPTIAQAVGYDQFWPFFMDVHQHPGTRLLHGLATVLGLGCALIAFPLSMNPAWLLIGLGVSYPIAWISHFAFERRRPAAFTNPIWALLCDVEMLILMATGGLDAEFERLRRDRFSEVSSARHSGRRSGQFAMVAYIVGYVALELMNLTRFTWPF